MDSNTENFVTNVQNDMRGDAGIGNNEQQIEQITWILFLKVYFNREQHWILEEDNYQSIIPAKYQWDNWAKPTKDSWPELIKFVNNDLIPHLKNIPIHSQTPARQAIVHDVFTGVNNHMQNGVLLRKVINDVDALHLDTGNGNDAVADIYEEILRSMQAQHNSGEYYTPRPLTDFVTSHLHIKLGDKIGDMAVGTGGFLTSSLKILKKQVHNAHDLDVYSNSVSGKELHFLPFLLCVTNLFLHGVDNPDVIHGDSLSKNVSDYDQKNKFNVMAMNPPYGQNKLETILNNFPYDLRSNELSDLFIVLVMYLLKPQGRAGLILPDSFMFGTSPVKQRIKAKLFNDFNVKLIVRLPKGVFQPYTSINTNVVFFDNTYSTKKTWFYRIDLPKGMKQFTKTRPITRQSFSKVNKWLKNPKPITIHGNKKAEQIPIQQIKKRKYDLSYVGFGQKHTDIKDPMTLLNEYLTQKHQYDKKIASLTKEVKNIFGGKDNND
ncbi:MAG: SAM-dependent DNA methyltransferase [Acetilactobacillus jinshanensis]